MSDSPRSRVAIVEDEFIVALDIKGIVERAGYDCAGMFASGEDLVEAFAGIRPDLVLMDIRIKGGIDGVDTARIVHERWRVPVVLLTAYADEATVSRAKLTEPFGYVLKPFEERELRTAIEIALYRAAMERRLRDSEERYRRLFHDGISGNFLAEPGGRVVEANPAFRRLLGFGPEDALPGLPELFPEAAAWDSFLAGMGPSGSLSCAEIELRARDGSAVVALANAGIGPDGLIQGELFDATERRALEGRLLVSQKMEAIGRLAGGIAHDFNNILTAIMGYANLLSEELSDPAAARDDVAGIKKAAGKAANLTRELLAFSRRQPAAPRLVDLGALVRDMERMLGRLLTEGISLRMSLPDSPVAVLADPTQVEQILVNLVVNARDAMEEGGILEVAVTRRNLDAPRAVALDTLAPGDWAVLSVRDEGVGVPPGLRGRIFEPFFTTKQSRGTGLGLSTVYGIAKQAGGGVDLESEPGRGSLFSVWIPAAGPYAGTAEPVGPPPAPGKKARSGTVLFVDDDEELRKLGVRLLSKSGWTILPAANAGEAILIAEGYGRSIDLLVTDVVMPLMDGYRLARRLRDLMPGLPVLYISGNPDSSPGREGERFLQKPFTDGELEEAVDASVLAARSGS